MSCSTPAGFASSCGVHGSNGTTHLDFTPHELIARLAAFVPRPRVNLVLYHGVAAPNAKLRRAVVG